MSSLDTTNACGTNLHCSDFSHDGLFSFQSCTDCSDYSHVRTVQIIVMYGLYISSFTSCRISVSPMVDQTSFTSCWMLLFTPFKMNPVLHLVGCVGTYRTTLSPLDKLNNSFISCRIWLSSTISPIKRSHTVLYHVWIWAPDLG